MTSSSSAAMKASIQKPSKVTPMMRQYFEIKSEHPDGIVFYRLGDFYEMFFEDAQVASRILDLTLTARNKNSDEAVPMCGIPYHAAENYISKLIQNGKKVVVCEQTEDAKQAKGLVKREVTRVVSPGVILETESLNARESNYVMSVYPIGKEYIESLCDVSTGEWEFDTKKSWNHVLEDASRFGVRELIYPENFKLKKEINDLEQQLPTLYHHPVSDLYADKDFATDLLLEYFQIEKLAGLGLNKKDDVLPGLGLLLGYLKEYKILEPHLLNQPKARESSKRMVLDEVTIQNLELFRTIGDEKKHGTLLWHLDGCQTPMGSRTLASFMRMPLSDTKEINSRLDAVDELKKDTKKLEQINQALTGVADLERLANRFLVGAAHARDAILLAESFAKLPLLKNLVDGVNSRLLQSIHQKIFLFEELQEVIAKTLVEEPPLSLKDGGIIKDGVSKELDELRDIEKSGKSIIAKLEADEKEKTGITSLKIRYNSVFGYYIEVTNTHKDKVPDHYIRKQTLTNAERYITDELKQYESKVLGASERIKVLEYDLFCGLREKIRSYADQIKTVAAQIALLDVLANFANLAIKFRYIRPTVANDLSLKFVGARHPILERLNPSDQFVPNDINLESPTNSMMMITGPNMAGKSTLMRMSALIIVMAQMGCFVPCGTAHVGVCDRIFTRVGAHDSLQKGLSTFMVEMVETAKILREATSKSFVLLDEIGRGTSTFDGVSIAWAVAEDIHDRLGARTMFATHYHELCDLSEQKRGIHNFHMSVKEWNGQIIFLRKICSGGTNRSYGVTVAGMAGISKQVIGRAKEILKLLEQKDLSFRSEMDGAPQPQMSLFDKPESEVERRLKKINVNEMTPLEALSLLAELKDCLNK